MKDDISQGIRMQNKQMIICENISGPPVCPTDCNLAASTSTLLPTCTAWRSRCRIQTPPSATGPKSTAEYSHSDGVCYHDDLSAVFLTRNPGHPSRVLSGLYSRLYARIFSQDPEQWPSSISQCYPGSRHGIPNQQAFLVQS